MKAETGFGKVWSCLPVLANWNGTLSFLGPSLHPCTSDSKINRSTNLLINSSFCLRADVSYFLCCTRKTKEIGDVCTQAIVASACIYLFPNKHVSDHQPDLFTASAYVASSWCERGVSYNSKFSYHSYVILFCFYFTRWVLNVACLGKNRFN